MKTNQVLETIDRELCGRIVRQRTKDGFMRLWDIESIGKLYRIQNNLPEINYRDWICSNNVKEFLAELEVEIGTKPYIRSTKANSGWVHPFFAIKILTHFNPRFEVQVYKWLWDYLIENRIKSGDSYNTMCGVLWKYTSQQTFFKRNMANVARIIKELIGVDDWNKATQEQLESREYLHNLIIDFTRTFKDSKTGLNHALLVFKSSRKYNALTKDTQ